MPLVVKCPVCQAQAPWEGNPHRPFCSERCQLVDLGAWAEGRYRIPGSKVKEKSEPEGGADEESS